MRDAWSSQCHPSTAAYPSRLDLGTSRAKVDLPCADDSEYGSNISVKFGGQQRLLQLIRLARAGCKQARFYGLDADAAVRVRVADGR